MIEDDIIIELMEQEVENLEWLHSDAMVIYRNILFSYYPKKIRETTTQRTEKI